MATSTEIKQRANILADKTDVNSITPKEVGGIMYDLASHGENVLRNGGTLGIRKVYESVAAMEADSTNPKDFWGDPIKKGNLVVIYDGTTTGVDNNKIYAFMKPGWELATKLDAAYATKAETDAKLAELGKKLILVDDVILNKYRSSGGIIYQHEMSYYITAPYLLQKGATILFDNVIPNVLPLCQVDESNGYIKTLVTFDSGLRKYTATEDILVSFSGLYKSKESYPIVELPYSVPSYLSILNRLLSVLQSNVGENAEDIANLRVETKEKIDKVESDILINKQGINNVGEGLGDKVDKSYDLRNILNPNTIHWGGIWQNDNYREVSIEYGYSDLIKCPYPKKLIGYRLLADGNNVTFSVYGEDKKYLRQIKATQTSFGVAIFESQEGDYYVRCNFIGRSEKHHANYGSDLNEYYEYNENPIYGYLGDITSRLESLNDRVDEIEGDDNEKEGLDDDSHKALFSSVLCIGDSMTAGWRKNLGDLKNYSYPTFMSRMAGWNVQNAATGGQTPKGWWNNYFEKYNYTDYDAAIIYLGQNEGLTDTLEEDVNKYSDYMQYETTNTGCYCKIIEGMLLSNPKLKIFLLSGTSVSDWDNINGVVINKIAQKYSLPVFNIKNNVWIDLLSEKYHPDFSGNGVRDNIHYGTLGYYALGTVVYNYILKYLSENEDLFSSWPHEVQM